ncbi:MAG: fumarylacetoacetate hydrolase family protein [Chloroflexi bacterium]|nr:fumarylacetoacetate hydrolase family protein [Chloroflexota bacterium]
MYFVTFGTPTKPRLGLVEGDAVIDLAKAVGDARLPGDMLSLIEAGPAALKKIARLAAKTPRAARKPLSSLRLLAPIPHPRRNVFCLGLNYAEHAKESAEARGREVKLPQHPVFFTKATGAVNGPFDDIPCDPQVTQQLDWEVELGVIIGKAGKNIPREKAMEYVFGYTVVNDVSARDLQWNHQQFFKGKSLDGACPMGPWIVTADEIDNPHALAIRCRVNGVTKQDSTTANMIFTVPAIVEILSRGLTLQPGDVIATGTPSGVGFARTPPEFLQPGDVVECEVEKIGVIRNRIA